jgi:Ni,Fe-hydrogenase III large subunit
MPIIKLKKDTRAYAIVCYYLELKDQTIERGSVFNRLMKRAKEILELADGNIYQAKELIDKTKNWADKECLEWSLETVFKRYLELNKEQPKLSPDF